MPNRDKIVGVGKESVPDMPQTYTTPQEIAAVVRKNAKLIAEKPEPYDPQFRITKTLASYKDMPAWGFPVIIGIAGRMCSGKDTLMEALQALDPRYRTRRISMEIMRDIARGLGISVDMVEADPAGFRTLKQEMGATGRRIYGNAYYAQRMLYNATLAHFTHIIVPDVRHVEDVATLQQVGVKCHMVRLMVSDEQIISRYKAKYGVEPTAEQMQHPSETALLPLTLAAHDIWLSFEQTIDTSEARPEDVAHRVDVFLAATFGDDWQSPHAGRLRASAAKVGL